MSECRLATGLLEGARASESYDVFRGSDGFEFDRSGHESFGSDPYAHKATSYTASCHVGQYIYISSHRSSRRREVAHVIS